MTNIKVAWGTNHCIITEDPGGISILIEGKEEILKTCNSLLRWLNLNHPDVFNSQKGENLVELMEKALEH